MSPDSVVLWSAVVLLAIVAIDVATWRLWRCGVNRWSARRDCARRAGSLPLGSLLLAGALACAALFVLLAWDVSGEGMLSLVDAWVGHWMAGLRTPGLVKLFAWLTPAGSGAALAPLALVAAAFLGWTDRPDLVRGLAVAVFGTEATTWAIKFAVARPRPEFLVGIDAWSPSFPSGHASAAAAVYGFIGYALACSAPGPRASFEATFWAVAGVALIAFSRPFLSLHYFSDVLGGLLLGGMWVLLAIITTTTGQPPPR